MTEAETNLLDLLLSEDKKGNVVIHTIEGLATTPLKDIIEQPATGILYDLNRLEECIIMDNSRCINDWASAKVIRALKARIEELQNDL